MDSTIISAIIGAIATIIAAIIGVLALREKKRRKTEKEITQTSDYRSLLEAFTLGCGIFSLGCLANPDSELQVQVSEEQQNAILRLVEKFVSRELFPSLWSLIPQVFAKCDFQTVNTLHKEITNAIFDSHPAPIQISYVLGVYLPLLQTSLKKLNLNSPEAKYIYSKMLDVLIPLRKTIYRATDIFPKEFIGWYENILTKRKVVLTVSKIIGWYKNLG